MDIFWIFVFFSLWGASAQNPHVTGSNTQIRPSAAPPPCVLSIASSTDTWMRLMKPRTKRERRLCENQTAGKHPDQWISSWQAPCLGRLFATSSRWTTPTSLSTNPTPTPSPAPCSNYTPPFLKHQLLDKCGHAHTCAPTQGPIYYSLKKVTVFTGRAPGSIVNFMHKQMANLQGA